MTIIKKYPNRKLYNTANSMYVSYRELIEFLRNGESFAVIDHRTHEDITNETLARVIFHKEQAGLSRLSFEALAEIVRWKEGTLSEQLKNWIETVH